MSTKRKSGIELLRIIAMLQIIVLHICNYGALSKTAAKLGGNYATGTNLLWSFCRSPVNIFIIITGYFIATSEISIKTTISKAWKTYSAMLFYSVSIAAVFFIATPEIFLDSKSNILRAFMPFFSREWYFLTNYLIILLLSPVINTALMKIDKKQYLWLLFTLFILLSLWPTLSSMSPFSKVIGVSKIVFVDYGKSLLSFIFLYVIGGYLRRFTREKEKTQYRFLFIFIGLCLLDFGIYQTFINQPKVYSSVFGAFSNPLVVLESVSLFMFFRDLKFSNKIVNFMAGTAIGIYAIHEHRYVRNWMWKILKIDDVKFLTESSIWEIGLRIILVTLLVFSLCALIELGRQYLFKFIGYLMKKWRPDQKIKSAE